MTEDGALENALARRKEIERQLPALTAELKRLNKFIAAWFEMAGVAMPATLKRQSGNHSIPRVVNPPKEAVASEALSVLTESGRPMMCAELLEALKSRGLILNGKDPAMVLSTMLWRSKDKITRTRDGYIPARTDHDLK